MIGEEYQAIVITGLIPAGKPLPENVRSLQLMGQAGLPIPVEEESKMGILQKYLRISGMNNRLNKV